LRESVCKPHSSSPPFDHEHFEIMGAQVAKWIDAEWQRGHITTRARNLELRIAAALAREQERERRAIDEAEKRRQKACKRPAPSTPTAEQPSPPPQQQHATPKELLDDKKVHLLQQAGRREDEIIKKYMVRAFQASPVVDLMDVTIGGKRYELPRVSLCEPLSSEEYAAISKQYVTARHMPSRRALRQRSSAVFEKLDALAGGTCDAFVVADATGYVSAVFDRRVYDEQGKLGERVLHCLNLLMGLDGFMSCCMGSGAVTGHDERNTLKHSNRLHGALGLPASSVPIDYAITGSEEHPLNGSARLVYSHEDGASFSYQTGAWIARRELLLKTLSGLLAKHRLQEYMAEVVAYMEQSEAMLVKYGALLLCCGEDAVPEAHLGNLSGLPNLWSILSLVLKDSGNKSRFGAHTDTEQGGPCLCSEQSAYPPGFYDFEGGELCFFNGMFAASYGYYGACLLVGHRALHAPLGLRHGQPPPHAKGLPMLRASTVLWTRGGETYPGNRDEYRRWLAQGEHIDNHCMAAKRQELETEACALLCPDLLPPRRRSAGPVQAPPASSFDELCNVSSVAHPMAAQLRLRGGGGRCKKK